MGENIWLFCEEVVIKQVKEACAILKINGQKKQKSWWNEVVIEK